MQIDKAKTQYILPSYESYEPSMDGATGVSGEDSGGNPSRISQALQGWPPASGDWKDLLGLNAVFNSPIQIDPPVLPAGLEGSTRADMEGACRQFTYLAKKSDYLRRSPKLKRMIDSLFVYHQSQDQIRERSLKGQSL